MEFKVTSRNETTTGWNINASNDKGGQLILTGITEAEASKYKPGTVIKVG